MRWFRRARGGVIPGGHSGDSVPVRLSSGSAFVSDEVRDQLGDDGVRWMAGLGPDAEIYSPRDWPNVP